MLDFVLPTSRGHRWAETQHRLAWNQWGNVTLLNGAERSLTCPPCGSAQLIESKEIEALAPLDFWAVVEYPRAFLADWKVFAYNHSLAEASLDVRERVAKRLRQDLVHKMLPGKEKHNLRSGAPEWSGMIHKLVLFPIYVGGYSYCGKGYCLFINAYNGKVNGAKPLDRMEQAAFFPLFILSVVVFGLWVTY